jgi:predicted dehydrogenase
MNTTAAASVSEPEREESPVRPQRSQISPPPRVGFLGVGWIGCNRMQAIANSHAVEIAAIADPAEELRHKAAEFAPNATLVENSDELFATDLDAIVIATPSALHAAQSIAALQRGFAVFCQKPLARTAAETREVVAAAKRANVLLGVDFSYRFMTEVKALCDHVR